MTHENELWPQDEALFSKVEKDTMFAGEFGRRSKMV